MTWEVIVLYVAELLLLEREHVNLHIIYNVSMFFRPLELVLFLAFVLKR